MACLTAVVGWACCDTAEAQPRTVPRDSYLFALQELYAGEYSNALRDFQSEYRGALKAPHRWIDSICFHAMIGECYYQTGMYAEARDEFNAALNLFAVHADWMLNMQWRELTVMQPGQVKVCPWGRSTRPAAFGSYQETVGIMQGRVNNNAVFQQGGVVQEAVSFPSRWQEITRATIHSLRRRRELLGVVAKFDPSSNPVIGAFTGTAGKPVSDPNHWSSVIGNLQAGLAYSAAGNDPQAFKLLEAGLYAGGQYVHPFSGAAYFELGRIKMSLGQYEQAQDLFLESTYASFQYNDVILLEEAFRYAQMAHLLSNKPGVYPPLAKAAAWSRGQRDLKQLHASLMTLVAENSAVRGDPRSASAALVDAKRSLGVRDMLNSKTGARFNYVNSLVNYQTGKIGPGDDALASALAFQRKGSLWLWHLRLADSMYAGSNTVPARDAMEMYAHVLREPTPADWLSDPLETLSALTDPHSTAIERWFHVALERKEHKLALLIADLARRHRFYSTLPFGGRLLSLRWLLESPESSLKPEQLLERQAILGQYPAYVELRKQSERLREEIRRAPLVVEDPEAQKLQAEQFRQLGNLYVGQETVLREIAVRRQPCEMVFPPKRGVDEIQRRLPERTAVLAFFATPLRVFGIMISKQEFEIWEVGPPAVVHDRVAALMRSLGHLENNRVMPISQLENESWRKLSQEMWTGLVKGARTDFPAGFDEVVVVPDAALWYVPFEMLRPSDRPGSFDSLLATVRVRYAPTTSLTVHDGRGRVRSPATAVAVGKLYPRDDEAVARDAFARLSAEMPGAAALDKKVWPAPMSLYTSLFDQLVIYDDVAPPSAGPIAFSPIPAAAGAPGASLDNWLTLPWAGPDVVVMPGYHTAAESSLKKIKPEMSGADVFLPLMGFMASGTRTVLFSRWRPGGKTSFDMTREFIRELPHTSAADAWQRSVLLAVESPLQPSQEPRVQFTGAGNPPPPSHPFFWAGFMTVDSGLDPQAPVDPTDMPLLDPKLEEKRKLLEQIKAQQELKAADPGKPANPLKPVEPAPAP